MVYGDGSNVIFRKGSLTSLTVTAHEFNPMGRLAVRQILFIEVNRGFK